MMTSFTQPEISLDDIRAAEKAARRMRGEMLATVMGRLAARVAALFRPVPRRAAA